MECTSLKNLDLDIYHGTLSNGLRYYIVPKNDNNNFYVTLSTDYGSNQIEFIPYGEKKLKKVPAGIAHFLEHKMFESEEGIDPFSLFDQNGESANERTDNKKTTYLFSGTTNFEENLKILLNYVNEPYFTDENVEKEKGIINQEIDMCNDSYVRKGYDHIIANSFVKNSIRIPTIGSKESIDLITKEDLYTCYNTFYQPSNMFLVITGNVDVEKTVEIISTNQNTEMKPKKIKIKKYKEPNRVKKKTETIYMNVTTPKVYAAYKLNIDNINLDIKTIKRYFYIYLDSLFGGVSNFYEEMKKNKIIDESIGFWLISTDTHLLIVFLSETKKSNKLIKGIDELIGSKITEEEFERKKKTFISSLVYTTDNIYSTNKMLMDDIVELGDVNYNIYDDIKSMNYKTLNDILSKINFENKSKLIIKPKK